MRNAVFHNWHKRDGYILLLSTLFVGAISSIILTSVLLLGTNSSQVNFAVEQSGKALAAAHACADSALLSIRENPSYDGNEFLTVDAYSTCEILPIGGTGNTNRLLCTEGQVGDTIRRFEIVISQIFPQVTIASWQEVSLFSLCE